MVDKGNVRGCGGNLGRIQNGGWGRRQKKFFLKNLLLELLLLAIVVRLK